MRRGPVSASATLVLLPGLDGTDVFLRPLVAALPPAIRPVVVTYPTSGAEEYRDVLDVVRRATAGLSAFYVLGVSFWGPLAVMLAREEPKRVKGVILVATFVQVPRPWLRSLRFACWSPMFWVWRVTRRLPMWASRSGDDPMRVAKAETFRRVPTRCLAGRARAVLDVDVRAELRACSQPVQCIAFTEDRVVPRRNIDAILREAPTAACASVPGSHFSGWTNSGVLAADVEAFISRVASTESLDTP
jgi:pimeloyl-ACP methyl ester carboxylesterase